MTIAALARVQYFDKQFLRVDEFRDEQLYQLALRRRHNITQHIWGIVRGLELAIEDESAVVVRPGVAIDGYGRELVLEAKKRLTADAFDDLGTDRLDVWLVYDRTEGSSPSGYGDCGGSSGQSYRAAEVPRVLVERPLANRVEPRRPPGVPAEVLDAPQPRLSDSPSELWRIYLGRMIRTDDGILVDAGHRPYAGVVAECIDHPANATRVEIGGQSIAQRTIDGVAYTYEPDGGIRRFAVFVGDPSVPKLTPRLEVRADDEVRLRGQTIVEGNLRMSGGAVRFAGTAAIPDDVTTPMVYRVNEGASDQLRIDLGAGAMTRQFVIGFTKDGNFIECLKVELADKTNSGTPAALVSVSGDLQVAGKISGNHVDPALSAEALAAIFGSFQAGLAAGNSG
jgi:hypothetical protein